MYDPDQIEDFADRLSREAVQQGRRAVVGLLAAPTSVALGIAATVTWATAFLERGFVTFERSFDRVTGGDSQDVAREPLLPREERKQKNEQQARS